MNRQGIVCGNDEDMINTMTNGFEYIDDDKYVLIN
jgi:hypothetical protein